MTSMPRGMRYAWYSLWYLAVTVVVIAAVSLSVVRLLLPFAGDYKNSIEAWVSSFVGHPVEISEMDAGWEGIEPQLVLKDVVFFSRDKKRIFADFNEAKIGLNLSASILQRSFVPGRLTIVGARLVIVKTAEGKLTVEGFSNQGAADDSNAGQLLSDWLFSRRLLVLKDSDLVWRDLQANQRDWAFKNVNLRLRNEATHHLIDGSVLLPSQLGDNLSFALDIQGDLLAEGAWSGKIYLAGEKLKVEQWIASPKVGQSTLEEGVAEFRLWSQWSASSLTSVRGTVRAQDLRLRSKNIARIVTLDSVGGDFSVSKEPLGWRVVGNRVHLVRDRGAWPLTNFDFRYISDPKTVQLDTSFLDIDTINQLLLATGMADENILSYAEKLRPSGELTDIRFFYNSSVSSGQSPQSAIYKLSAHVQDFSNKAWEKIPAVNGVSGDIVMAPNWGNLRLSTSNWTLDYPSLFSQRLAFDSASGYINWQKVQEQWQLTAKNLSVVAGGVAVGGKVALDFPKDASPFLDLVMNMQSQNAADVTQYLPSGLMSPKVIHWMDASIVSGKIASGGVVFYGPVKEFPFAQRQGKFDLRFDLKDGVLEYQPGWPRITDIDGEFRVSGYDLEFNARNGKIFSNQLKDVNVKIEDFKTIPLQLKIAGRASGSSDEKLRYMHESPLEKSFAKALSPFKMRGNSDLDITLDIPLAAGKALTVDGAVAFNDNQFLALESPFQITDINGVLAFDEKGISSDSIKGVIGGHALNARVATHQEPLVHSIVISSQGVLTQNQLNYFLATFAGYPNWADYFVGETQLYTELDIPLGNSDANERAVELKLQSDMLGMAVTLPPPLLKSGEESKSFYFNLPLSGTERNLRLFYDDIDTILGITTAGGKQHLERGSVGLGVAAELPTEFGFRFKGALKEFSWTKWSKLLFPSDGSEPLLRSEGPSSTQYYDVNIGKLEFFGSEFSSLALQMSNSTQGWSVHTTGPDMEGNMYFPVILQSAPLVMDMERLFLHTTPAAAKETSLDPVSFPELKLKSKHFKYNALDFGAIDLDAKRAPDGLRLEKLNLTSNHTAVTAKGNWRKLSVGQVSQFNINVSSTNLGKALSDWNYAGAIAGGNAKLDIIASWNGNPTDFGFERLQGDLKLKVQGGRLLDVDPGASRIFGLLSLQALPRRLFLDFRDVFSKGMTFDLINGEFKIENGDAFTSGLVMDGPTARIDMAGRVGLATEDYDQVVTVVPKTLDSLPLLGLLAVTPQVGATIFVMKQLLQKQIDEISTLQFTVTGKWKDPVVKRVEKAIPQGTPDILNEGP